MVLLLSSIHIIVIRGGVEDTRLEAKAKDTKKNRGHGQGQGQPFRGQTLLRPGMWKRKRKLEAVEAVNFCGSGSWKR